MERLESMKTLLSQLIRDTNEKIQDGEKYFNTDIERAIIESKKGIDHIYYEYLSNYYKVKSALASLKYKFHNMQDIVNISSTIHDVTNILSEIGVINTRANVLIAKNEIYTHGAINDDRTDKLLKKIHKTISTLENKTRLLNPFVVYDKPSKSPFMNSEFFIEKLKDNKEIITRFTSTPYGDIIEESILLLCGVISDESFKQISRGANLSDSGELVVEYTIKIFKDSDIGKLLHKYKNDHQRIQSLISAINWDDLNHTFDDMTGDIVFTYTVEK